MRHRIPRSGGRRRPRGPVHDSRPTIHGRRGHVVVQQPAPRTAQRSTASSPPTSGSTTSDSSSVRFNSGGSGSFVSPDGLVMTNHHVGADDLQKLSDREEQLPPRRLPRQDPRPRRSSARGWNSTSCIGIKDVTAEVESGRASRALPPAEAFKARQAKIAETREGRGRRRRRSIRADVVTLYAGGQYHLYTFKKYTDIRLVFAPEKQIAFFGGDPDNFEYPRYDLDVCFFRVYENDKPVKCEHYLKWSPNGSKEGELVFVSGHPGRTNRQNTVAELEYLRDTGYPYLLQRLNRLRSAARRVGRAERGERAAGARTSCSASRTAARPASAASAGCSTRSSWAARSPRRSGCGSSSRKADGPCEGRGRGQAFDTIAKAEKVRAELIKEIHRPRRTAAGFNSPLVRHRPDAAPRRGRAAEADRRAAPRVRRRPAAESLKFQLFSDEPIYEDFETLKLADGLHLPGEHARRRITTW